jgi:ribosomal protein S18 acetylase RimI-like enzyme
VRDSKEEDLAMLVDLKRISERELNWEPPEEYLEEFSKIVQGIYERDKSLIKVAEADGELVGYCISVKDLHSYNGVVLDITMDSAYIWELFVLKEEHHRKGIGSQLLEEAIQHLKSIGKARCYLSVNYRNEEGKGFWEKKGFTLRGYLLEKRL